MNRFRISTAVITAAMLFAGCTRLYPTEQLSLSEHNSPYVFKEVTEAPTEAIDAPVPVVSDYYALRTVLLGYISEGVEHGEVMVERYDGDLEDDLKTVVRYLTQQNPVSAYAADYINCERSSVLGGWLISIDTVYRRTAKEIKAIEHVRGSEEAFARMVLALNQLDSSITLQVSGYHGEDFASKLQSYILNNPDKIVQAPQITLSFYPDAGNVRVVEVHFVYADDRETLRVMKNESTEVLDSVLGYIRYGDSDEQKVRMLFTYLTTRSFSYYESDNASVYSLLCKGISKSMSAASVVRYLCDQCGVECYLIQGTKDGEPWYWNVVPTQEGFRHVDFQRDILANKALGFLTDDQMDGYSWERESVPACEITPITENETTQADAS
ncbi:MAG: hypothetical protein II038_04165 [Lachnospiraceae bacterium]|nr:hypothetical protein [Lachnospiraceae bacterium]